MAGLSTQILRYFPTIVKKYIEFNRYNWTQALIQHRMKTEYPKIVEGDIPAIHVELRANKFSRSDYYSRHTVSAPYTTKLFVVIPPIHGNIQTFQETLITLQILNVISYVQSQVKNRWQVAKGVVIVFSHPFYEYKDSRTKKETNRKLFACMNELEMENRQRIYCLSDGGSPDLVKVGLYDICNCEGTDPTVYIKSEKLLEYYIPTLLPPTHVIFPYQLNVMSGILISGEEEILEKTTINQPNPFTIFHRSPLYGKFQAVSIKRGYPLSIADPSICAVRMDAALNRFRIDTKAVSNIDAIIKKHIAPLVQKVIGVCTSKGLKGLDHQIEIALLTVAKKDVHADRGEFIVKTEAIIKIKKTSIEIIKSITKDLTIGREIQQALTDYPIAEYDKYLRFPFTDEVVYIHKKEQNEPIKPMGPLIPTPDAIPAVAQAGGGLPCQDLLIHSRTKTLRLFDKENYILDTILFLNTNSDYQTTKCLPHIKSEIFGQVNKKKFVHHHEEHEINNKYDIHLINVGGKFFEVRKPSEDVINNWRGKYKHTQSGGDGWAALNGTSTLTDNSPTVTTGITGVVNELNNGTAGFDTVVSSAAVPAVDLANSQASGWAALNNGASTLTGDQSTATTDLVGIVNELNTGKTGFDTMALNNALHAIDVVKSQTTTVANKSTGLSFGEKAGIAAAGIAALGLVGTMLSSNKSSGATLNIPTIDKSESDIKPHTPVVIGGKSEDPFLIVDETLPILIQGEADLLNSLHLEPKDLPIIFDKNNKYGLTSWKIAIPEFFTNLIVKECYKDAVLLTRAECQNSRNFLYSINEYYEVLDVKKDNNPEYFADSDSDSDDSVDHDLVRTRSSISKNRTIGNFGEKPGVDVLTQVVRDPSTYINHNIDGKFHPAVKAIAVDKGSGKKIFLSLYLEDVLVNDIAIPVSEEHKTALSAKVTDLNREFSNYVIYTY